MADPKDPPPEDPPRVLPDIDFATFILSLGSSALQHLGEVPDGDGKKELDLPLAKQTIDLLALIEEKTKGNLDSTEEQLLSGLLYDLRIKYVDARKR
jgi:uncharacterized protein DUF1844